MGKGLENRKWTFSVRTVSIRTWTSGRLCHLSALPGKAQHSPVAETLGLDLYPGLYLPSTEGLCPTPQFGLNIPFLESHFLYNVKKKKRRENKALFAMLFLNC